MENTVNIEQIKKNLAEVYAEYCSDYWYAVCVKRRAEREGAPQTEIDLLAERVISGLEKRGAFRKALKVSGLFTEEERRAINQAQKRLWISEFEEN